MSRILVVERDASGRALMDRALVAAGYATDSVGSIADAEELLEREGYTIAIVDELAGSGATLDEVRAIRKRYPRVMVICTGTLLSQRVLLELMRLGVAEALPKPFLPDELRAAVERVKARQTPDEDRGLDWAAAINSARELLGEGHIARAERRLAHALSIAPLDPEAVALYALLVELRGDDGGADRAFRAGMALRDDESALPPMPREGLARLAAYAGARPVDALPPCAMATFVESPETIEGPGTFILTVGVIDRPDAFVHLRAGAERSFAVSLGEARPETVAAVLDRIGAGDVQSPTRLDLDRVRALRRP